MKARIAIAVLLVALLGMTWLNYQEAKVIAKQRIAIGWLIDIMNHSCDINPSESH